MKKPLLSLLLIVLVLVLSAPEAHSQQEKPNILFIAIDDLKPVLGCYGDTMVKSPNIDGIANQGITFMYNYCQQAVCAPSRASLLTSRYPDQLKVWDLKTVIREKNPGIVTLPQYFKNNGYETAATGKIFDPRSLEGGWGGSHDAPSWSIEYTHPGDFYNKQTGPPEYYYASASIKDSIKALKAEAISKGFTGYNEMRNYVQERYWPPVENADVPYDAYIDGTFANHGIHLMEEMASQEKPFFLAVGFHRPHLPFNAPKVYWDMYNRDEFTLAEYQQHAQNSPSLAYHNSGELRNGYTPVPDGNFNPDFQKELIHGYYAATSYIDAMIGKLIDKLDELGLADNTILVLWGDHGWHLGDHGLWCKHSNFEQAVKAPLIIKAPTALTEGIKYDGPTEFTDIAPTLCAMAGINIPTYFEGENLEPLFTNPELDLRSAAFSQYPRNGKKYMGYSVRTKRYRYTKWIDTNTGEMNAKELYDYEVDPLETVSFINHANYDSVENFLDSLVNERIAIPSTQARIQLHIFGRTPEGDVYPLPDCTIHLDGFKSTTNSSGYALLTHDEGNYPLRISSPGYTETEIQLQLSGDTVWNDTLIAIPHEVKVEVKDAATLQVIDSFLLGFHNDTTLVTGAQYITSPVYSGYYGLSVTKKHYKPFDDNQVFIYSDTTIQLFLEEIRYQAEINVYDDYTNKLISGVEIDNGNILKTTDLEGLVKYVIPFGNYNFQFQKAQYQPLSAEIEIEKDTLVDIYLHKTHGDLKFKLKDGSTPVNKAMVAIFKDSLITNNLGIAVSTDLLLGKTYSYKILRECYETIEDDLFFQYDTSLNVQLSKTTPFLARKISQPVSIYPNPAGDYFICKSAFSPTFLGITNSIGQTLYNEKNPGYITEIDISTFPAGMYIVSVGFDNHPTANKLLYKIS